MCFFNKLKDLFKKKEQIVTVPVVKEEIVATPVEDNISLDITDIPQTYIDSVINKSDNKALIVKEALKVGITSRKELAMLLAQLHHESMGFTRLEESFSYKPENLLRTFPKYVKDLNDAKALLALGKKAVANRVYGGRMGNTETDDGWNYRGRGFIQLTGKNNYSVYKKHSGLPIVEKPDLLLVPENAAKVSLSYWFNRDGLRQAAKDGDVVKSTKLINGGTNGLEDRRSLYTKYLFEIGS